MTLRTCTSFCVRLIPYCGVNSQKKTSNFFTCENIFSQNLNFNQCDLLTCFKVRFSTLLDSTPPTKRADFKGQTSQRHESKVFSESLSGNRKKFNRSSPKKDEESFEEIYEILKDQCKNLPRREQILSTLNYLKGLGFSKDVILESVVICAYPRSKIKEGLKKIYENELKLNKFGLKGGFTQGSTNDFETGTHLPDKRLQLCLYYMEEPCNFNSFDVIIKKS